MVRMPKGDGSPCDQAFEWFESKKFQSREEIYQWEKDHNEELNKYMNECADNYPFGEIEEDAYE